MRNIFIDKLIKEALHDKDFYFLTGDLGYNAFEKFINNYPQQFINAGVAENNMIGVGAGMALSGKKVYIYSIIPFLVFRCLEQIRNIICHNNLDVKIIGTGGGFSYGNQGISHNPTEDLAIMRAIPNMIVFSPGSKIELELAIDYMINNSGPAYIRLGKIPEGEYLISKPNYKLGDGLIVKEGSDITLFSTGNITSDVIMVAKKLDSIGLKTQVVSFLCIKPINKEFIINIANSSKAIVTIEEHSIIGGFGSAVSEILLEAKFSNRPFKRIALDDKPHKEIGSHIYLKKINGLDIDGITKNIINFINNEN